MKILSVMLLICSASFAQQIASYSIENAKSDLASVEYTVGQPIYKFNKENGGTMEKRPEQSYEVSIVFGLGEMKDILISMSLYPNPTEDSINLLTGKHSLINLSYILSDNARKPIEQKKIIDSNTIITFNEAYSSICYVTVLEGSSILKTFKIIRKR